MSHLFQFLAQTLPKQVAIELTSIIHTLPVSTADCERGLSTMKIIATKTRNRLLVKTISNMLFLSLVGPPQAKFEPAKNVKEWLNCHRNVDDMRGSKVVENTDMETDICTFGLCCELSRNM